MSKENGRLAFAIILVRGSAAAVTEQEKHKSWYAVRSDTSRPCWTSRHCDTVAVMYLGKIVEYVDVDGLFYNPKHPYTQALLQSIPRIEDRGRARLSSIPGNVPMPIGLPSRCSFFDRCQTPLSGGCDCRIPEPVEVEPGHIVSCFLYGQQKEGSA